MRLYFCLDFDFPKGLNTLECLRIGGETHVPEFHGVREAITNGRVHREKSESASIMGTVPYQKSSQSFWESVTSVIDVPVDEFFDIKFFLLLEFGDVKDFSW